MFQLSFLVSWRITALSLLFQPIFKLPLGREVWNIVDIVTAVFLIYLYLKEMYEIRKR